MIPQSAEMSQTRRKRKRTATIENVRGLRGEEGRRGGLGRGLGLGRRATCLVGSALEGLSTDGSLDPLVATSNMVEGVE